MMVWHLFSLLILLLRSSAAEDECTIQRVPPSASEQVLKALLEEQRPLLLQQAAKSWNAHKLGQSGKLLSTISDKYGKTKLLDRSGASVASFGGQDAFASSISLKSSLQAIQKGQRQAIAFVTESSFGDKLYKAGLFELPTWAHERFRKNDKPQDEGSLDYAVSIGGDTEGLPFHVHGETLLGLAQGRKVWFIAEPAAMSEEVLLNFWNTSQRLASGHERPRGVETCTQNEGDILYLPPYYWHATVNLGISLAFGFQLNNPFVVMSDLMQDESYIDKLSVPELGVLGRLKLIKSMPNEGFSDLLHAFYRMPSYLPTAFHLIDEIAKMKSDIGVLGGPLLFSIFQHLRSLDSKTSLSPEVIAELFAKFGNGVSKLDASLSLKFLDEAIHRSPRLVQAWHNSAYANMLLGDQKETERRLRRALELDPKYTHSLKAVSQLGIEL